MQIRVHTQGRCPVPAAEIQGQPRLGDDHILRFRERHLGELATAEERGGARGGANGRTCAPRAAHPGAGRAGAP